MLRGTLLGRCVLRRTIALRCAAVASATKNGGTKDAAALPASTTGHALSAGAVPCESGGEGAATPAAALSSPFADIQKCMRRSYRLDSVLADTQHGMVFGKQDNVTTYSFVGFEHLPFISLAERMVQVAPAHRTFHAICGRANMPCDFFADIDAPLETTEASLEASILTAIAHITTAVARGTGRKRKGPAASSSSAAPNEAHHHQQPKVLLLRNVDATTKQSLHLYVAFPHACFTDYRVVRKLAESINDTLGAPFFDLACYRERGMMRLAFSKKVGMHLPNAFTPYFGLPTSSSSSLAAVLAPVKLWSPAQQLAMSFCLREEFLLSEPTEWASLPTSVLDEASVQDNGTAAERNESVKAGKVVEYDHKGRPIAAFLSERTKPRRYQEVVKCLRALPSRAAEPYDQWIRVGLAIHNFGMEERYFDEWVQFSTRAPHKFNRIVCKKMWDKFPRHSDHENWRRGYNYITKTIWRELGISRV